jgi:glycosyltransferase involved in cell wall biosynthesis
MIQQSGVPIVWTQHNLIPHDRQGADAAETYAVWARAAAVVLHHSEYGRRRALESMRYGSATIHVVVPHGHWGKYAAPYQHLTRQQVEEMEGWRPAPIRLAVIGQPRPAKDVQMVVDAVAQSARRDIQLVARVAERTTVPRDARVIAERGHLSQERYYRRLRAFDAVILPFIDSEMVCTGTAFDCIGAGLAPIVSNWGFLQEVFGPIGISGAASVESLVACIENLDYEQLASARAGALGLRARHEWEESAHRLVGAVELALLERPGTA